MNPLFVSSIVFAVSAPWLLLVSFAKATSFRQRQLLGALFCAVLGSVMPLQTGDGYRHQLLVEIYYSGMTFPDFVDDLIRILLFQLTESGARDVYKHILSYVLGGVLGTPGLFFPIVGFVYGYFFTGSLLLILRHLSPRRTNYLVLAFVVVLFFVKGLVEFYSVRTWTGMWVLVYACLRYHERPALKYALLMFVPPLIHFAYFLMALPAWVVLALGNRKALFAGLYIASSVTTFIPVKEATDVLSQTERGALEVEAYTELEQRDQLEGFAKFQERTNFYNAYRKAGLQRWAPTVLIYILLLSGVYLSRMKGTHSKLFSIGLLTMAFSNLTWFIYALHKRTLLIAMVFLLAGFLMGRLDPRTKHIFKGLPGYYKWGLHISLMLFAPMIMFRMSVLLERCSIYLVGMPFVVWLDPSVNLSFKQLIRMVVGG